MTKEQEEQSRVALLPCPFCNGKGHIPETQTGYFAAGCDNILCLMFSGTYHAYPTKRQAIAAWNTRATPSQPDKAEVVKVLATVNALLSQAGDYPIKATRNELLAIRAALSSLPPHRDDSGMVELRAENERLLAEAIAGRQAEADANAEIEDLVKALRDMCIAFGNAIPHPAMQKTAEMVVHNAITILAKHAARAKEGA